MSPDAPVRLKRSDRGRPVCIELGCDVEVNEGEKRCAAHNWHINSWLEKSRRALEQAKKREASRD